MICNVKIVVVWWYTEERTAGFKTTGNTKTCVRTIFRRPCFQGRREQTVAAFSRNGRGRVFPKRKYAAVSVRGQVLRSWKVVTLKLCPVPPVWGEWWAHEGSVCGVEEGAGGGQA